MYLYFIFFYSYLIFTSNLLTQLIGAFGYNLGFHNPNIKYKNGSIINILRSFEDLEFGIFEATCHQTTILMTNYIKSINKETDYMAPSEPQNL